MTRIDPTTVTNAQELERFAELVALELCDLIDGAHSMRSAVPYARALVVALEFSEAVTVTGAPPDAGAYRYTAGAIAAAYSQAITRAQEQAR